jgi:hypothetical protein
MTRRTRLSLQFLEGRDAPSGLDAPAQLFGQTDGVGVRPGPNKPPAITNFRAIVGPNGQVTFMGTVTDDTPVAGYVVRITGPGVDTYAIIQRDGTFSTTVVVSAVGTVTVSATTTDSGGARSEPVYTTFTPSP